MDGFCAHQQTVQDTPALRVCLATLLAFTFHRSDYSMVCSIERDLEGTLDEMVVRANLDRELKEALRDQVGKAELVWWLSLEQHVRSHIGCRAVFHRLALIHAKVEFAHVPTCDREYLCPWVYLYALTNQFRQIALSPKNTLCVR